MIATTAKIETMTARMMATTARIKTMTTRIAEIKRLTEFFWESIADLLKFWSQQIIISMILI